MRDWVGGDGAAFEEIFGRYGDMVLGYMRRGYRPEEDARDLTQQTFLQLHRARRDFRGDRPLRPWLMTIARNVLRDHLRRERRRILTEGIEGVLRDRGTAADETEHLALREALAAAVERLPASLRAVVEGHWKEHRSYADLARRLGTTRAAVKVRAHRAYRALREMLADEGYGPEGRPP